MRQEARSSSKKALTQSDIVIPSDGAWLLIDAPNGPDQKPATTYAISHAGRPP